LESGPREQLVSKCRPPVKLVLLLTGCVALTVSGVVLSQTTQNCSEGLICFTSNTPAKASEINENFRRIVPPGTVVFYDGETCPTGWEELEAARGRYIVGLSEGGTLGGTAGTALIDLEDRPTGRHDHSYLDRSIEPSPEHAYWTGAEGYYGSGQANKPFEDTTRITEENDTLVAGTNAPYIQLMVCVKLGS
jgi:hypothetical protein